jgi:hypothetical protein
MRRPLYPSLDQINTRLRLTEFPPRQKTGSFSLDQVLETLTRGGVSDARRVGRADLAGRQGDDGDREPRGETC